MKSTKTLAVASRSFSKHPVLRKELQDKYANITFNDLGRSLNGEELVSFLKGHEMVITALERLDRATLAALTDLKIVSKYGVGLDMIDLKAMEELGIKLGWTGGVNKRSVSELVVSAAISLLHRVPEACHEVRDGQWRQLRGNLLTGKTVGIVGCGHVGKDLAGLLKAFDCRLLAHDIKSFPEFYRECGIESVSLEALLMRSDIVTLHLPLDETTQNILSAERMALMKSGAYLINIARGHLLDETTLKQMLQSGHLSGACLDVFAQEPPMDMELIHLPNLIATPHIGGSSEEAILSMGRAAINGLETACLPSCLDI